jgi:hypothetical protein
MKHHDLRDPGLGDFIVSSCHLVHVQAADRAAGEPSELEVDQPLDIGQRDISALDCRQRSRLHPVTRVQHSTLRY